MSVLLAVLSPSALIAQTDVVAAIQVHGNTITATEEIVRLAGIRVGDAFSPQLAAAAEARLSAALHLESVEVLKRYASLSDPAQVLVVIQVDEGPVRIEIPAVEMPEPGSQKAPVKPAVVRRSRVNLMMVPILTGEDGYGLTYGIRLAFTGHRNTRRRLVTPVSWGGDKRAAAEFQHEFVSRRIPRLRTGGMAQRRTHPFFDTPADRRRVWGRAEWPLSRGLRAGTEVAWESSQLGREDVALGSLRADMVLDTRIDPLLPRNALLVHSSVERLGFRDARAAVTIEIDANAYVKLPIGAVLGLRGFHAGSNRSLPPFYKAILGGSSNLRGFRAGYAVGDSTAAGSAELRFPVTSPLRPVRFGYSAFMDVAAAYDNGERLREQRLNCGIGAGMWADAPLFRFNVAVARGLGSGTRAHISAGLTF
jgi:outer membrane protein assembly factor BamA